MRLIARDSLTPVPWKNGGGFTRQIACFPPGSDIGSFDWRISTAEVAQDGAFSRFEGIDRRLYVLAGAGLALRFGTGERRVLRIGEHIDFRGEADVHGGLLEGAVSDLNIMVRRERQRAWFEHETVSGGATLHLPWAMAAVFVRDGRISVGEPAVVANRFDTLLLDKGHAPRLAVSGAAELVLVGFDPVA